ARMRNWSRLWNHYSTRVRSRPTDASVARINLEFFEGEAMKSSPRPPKAFEAFVQRYPEIGAAWDRIGEAGKKGPLDEKTMRLVKFATSLGAFREGAGPPRLPKHPPQGIPPP